MAARGSGLAALKIELELDDPLEYVEPEELYQLLADGELTVVDVRTEEERADGCIAGSLHAPSEEWANERDLGPTASAAVQRSGALVFHCMYSRERGPRAARVAARAVGGASRVLVLRGGFQQCMAKLWRDVGERAESATGGAEENVLFEGVRRERWVPNGRQGLVWRGDLDEALSGFGTRPDLAS